MTTTKRNITEAINQEIRDFQKWTAFHSDQLSAARKNNMVGCVFVQQVSARRYQVGWRFTPEGTQVGEVQQDTHTSYNRDQKIAWVAN